MTWTGDAYNADEDVEYERELNSHGMEADRICDICGNPVDIHYDTNGEAFWVHGHNARPVVNGRCCDKCNAEVVPRKIMNIMRNKNE